MTASTATALALLHRLDALGRAHAGTPGREATSGQDQWQGVSFRLAGRYCVCRTGEVEEVVQYPALAAVPGARRWLKGIANVRGNLLPIMDLAGFLGDGMSTVTRSSRVLVVRTEQLSTGLLVDEALGIRQFARDSLVPVDEELPADMEAVMPGMFVEDEQRWLVLSVTGLVAHQDFFRVAG